MLDWLEAQARPPGGTKAADFRAVVHSDRTVSRPTSTEPARYPALAGSDRRTTAQTEVAGLA